ncbi:MAG TPA: VOC family protein [Anaerolineales bacterium]|nr:VOC family protein [Anaerolineales bacterium]HRQ92044.1 VOC family protein [Anaerolineales bacterium]
MSYKPANYNDLSPYLIVSSANGLMEFLEKALGATRIQSFEHEGRVRHAEMQVGDSVLMLCDANEQYPAVKSILHLYLADVDAAFASSLAAGGVEVHPPLQNEGEADRRGTFTDPFGNLWSLSTKIG